MCDDFSTGSVLTTARQSTGREQKAEVPVKWLKGKTFEIMAIPQSMRKALPFETTILLGETSQ
jgi:hypothetical protein